MEKKKTGEIISEYRKAKGLTQRALAEQLNITDKAVSKWERNVARPDIAIIGRLSEVLEIPPELLVDIPLSSSNTSQSATGSGSQEEVANHDAEDDQDADIRAYHMSRVLKLLWTGFLGFAGGFLFALIMEGDSFSFSFCCGIGLFFIGVPYGYQLLNRIVGQWFVIGNLFALLIAFAFKLLIAFLIGWAVYPIAVLFNLVKALRKGSKLHLAATILLGIAIAILVIFLVWQLVGAPTPNGHSGDTGANDDLPNVTLSDGTKTFWMTSTKALNTDNPTYLQVCEDALRKAIIAENEAVDPNCVITSPSALHAAYFLSTKDPNEEHWDYGHNVKIKNAIVVVSCYEINIWNTEPRCAYSVWFYPNCIVSDDGRFEYDTELVYDKRPSADSVDDVYNWLCEEYDDMNINSVLLPE